jgi:hypothetical protein
LATKLRPFRDFDPVFSKYGISGKGTGGHLSNFDLMKISDELMTVYLRTGTPCRFYNTEKAIANLKAITDTSFLTHHLGREDILEILTRSYRYLGSDAATLYKAKQVIIAYRTMPDFNLDIVDLLELSMLCYEIVEKTNAPYGLLQYLRALISI